MERYCQWNGLFCEQINTEICQGLGKAECNEQAHCFYNNSGCLDHTVLGACSSALIQHACQLVTLEKCEWKENQCLLSDPCEQFSDQQSCTQSGFGCYYNEGFFDFFICLIILLKVLALVLGKKICMLMSNQARM
jgi:hypothetical protein